VTAPHAAAMTASVQASRRRRGSTKPSATILAECNPSTLAPHANTWALGMNAETVPCTTCLTPSTRITRTVRGSGGGCPRPLTTPVGAVRHIAPHTTRSTCALRGNPKVCAAGSLSFRKARAGKRTTLRVTAPTVRGRWWRLECAAK
jgi:hypothetical protein